MISFKVLLNGFYLFSYSRIQSNIKLKPLIYKTNFRTFSKIINRKEFLKQIDDSNKESKIEITLKDQNNKILGVKTKAEAELLAKKSNLFLIEEKVLPNDKKGKHPVFKLVSTKQLAVFDDNVVDGIDVNVNDCQTSAQQLDDKKFNKKVKETKRLAFSAKVSQNDLITKIKSTKKWISKGFEIKIHINSPQNDKNHLEFIHQRFEHELKGLAKFTQKKLSDNDLKFAISPLVDSKDQVIGEEANDENKEKSIDLDNLDPNQLLSDEFEELLKKK